MLRYPPEFWALVPPMSDVSKRSNVACSLSLCDMISLPSYCSCRSLLTAPLGFSIFAPHLLQVGAYSSASCIREQFGHNTCNPVPAGASVVSNAISVSFTYPQDYDLVARFTNGLRVLLPFRGVNALSSQGRPSTLSVNLHTVSSFWKRT